MDSSDGGLGGDLLVDERTEDGAGGEKEGDGEECATGTGSHRRDLPLDLVRPDVT